MPFAEFLLWVDTVEKLQHEKTNVPESALLSPVAMKLLILGVSRALHFDQIRPVYSPQEFFNSIGQKRKWRCLLLIN